MLTKRQIKKIATRNKIPMHTQERDYIQNIFLYSLYPNDNIVFKGGTALRIAYGSNRYSEDLDFNSYSKNTEQIFRKVVKDLSLFGIDCEIKDEKSREESYSFRLVYNGPLYIGKEISRGGIDIEVSLRGEEIEKEKKIVSSPYDEISNFLLTVMSLEHIFAEKIRALIIRGKVRDLYDIWFLIERDVSLDKALIDKKLKLYNEKFSIDKLKKSVKSVKKNWKQDLDALLPSVPEFKVVSEKVISEFTKIGSKS